jgi:hypothetical protein
LPSWIRIRIRNLNADPDPDRATQINADPCGSGYGSETLPVIITGYLPSFVSPTCSVSDPYSMTPDRDPRYFSESGLLLKPDPIRLRIQTMIFWNIFLFKEHPMSS